MVEKIQFRVGDNSLAGVHFSKSGEQAQVLIIHGAGKSAKEKRFYIMERLLARGISSFAFDHGGVGESSGRFNDASLRQRVQEAVAAFEFMAKDKPVTVYAGSMGGYIAIKLSELQAVENLFLFCPAAYDVAAYALPFNEKFTAALRRLESWKDSDAYPILEKFKGNLRIYIGAEDDVIPAGVIELFQYSAKNTKSTEITRVPGCGHQIDYWLEDHPEWADKIADEVVRLSVAGV